MDFSKLISNSKLKNRVSKKSKFDNKTVLLEILKSEKMAKDDVVIEATKLWFTKTSKVVPTQTEWDKKETSIGNSYDTMKSNFNSEDKVEKDVRLRGHVWLEDESGNNWIE